MTSSVVGLGGSSKAVPKAKLAPKKYPGHCLVVCCQSTITCWNPAKTITSENYAQQINEMHQKLQCFQPPLFNRKGSVLHDNIQPYTAQPMLQIWMNWATKFCLIHHFQLTSHQPTTTSSSISTTFFQGKHFHNKQNAENAFQEFLESRGMAFYHTGIRKLLSHWQKCVDYNSSYFD